ncbi:TspO/MBR family protein [Pediococcus pentosaceus]|jgi:tryptophan-rich sensory protein|uniref:Tryptophan-rich sensory protein n=2 Tax=Pediococcus pentosaceus TaxID=1255 RepID=A0A512K5G1_PEDPE|nr:TspO/MBR family protein [Pediococcus pentosaceus]KAF0348771.1 tryptophan-rich sensory protein [Pediococcus pentosaceus]KAF0395761.1 tryptophan-rich sensory protein [Pediococcus pentosaceus]KAF0414997.1 tryptophan-rich sensory protein [Pediococcus pentosaceus]KAF0436290.1 tryptophan-rich sensory protein [Pediococcus pentosaceus]KAF0441738.1 tryptophan-rich sensory protein [Pediococcus pentosaceus]
MQTKSKWIQLIIAVVGVELIGSLSGLLAGDIKAIYNSFTLPPFSPPDRLFGIVWPILYLMIGIVGYLIFTVRSNYRKTNLTLFIAQLFLNFIWSIVFFNASSRWTGLLIILVLDALVFFCIKEFYKSSKLAAYLMIPYFLWILFATYLTLGTAILN